ncbi:MAG: ADP-ribosylglycohydrolase family protein [Deltaproteobacteria bacterium]|nr:ADP-ribosylglycohydrolase family protein [Deltaproteobacteria bacterium]
MSAERTDRIKGGLLGLALGDAFGAPHEGGPIERLLWRAIGRSEGKQRFTDDTTMSLDLAESLVERGALDLDDLARRFGASYRWSRGYGPGAAKLLKRVRGGMDWREASRSVYPEGSFGNGGAMRAPVIGLAFAARPEALADAASEQASITHAHPLAREGAVMIAAATAAALEGVDAEALLDAATAPCEQAPFTMRLEIARGWLRLSQGNEPSPREVRESLGNGIAAVDSCVTALYLAGRFLHLDFADLLRFAALLGGDVDTIGAMAGALWGAHNGAGELPGELLGLLEQRERLEAAAAGLAATFA